MKDLQQIIVRELGIKPEINPDMEIEQRTEFLADYLRRNRLAGYVLGISGGQDSTLSGLLAMRAVDKLHIEGINVKFIAVKLPYGEQKDIADAELAAEIIKPTELREVNIKPTVDAFAATMGDISDFDKGNVKARVRMITQYAIASEMGLAVIGTDHAAEAVMGFYTKYGDGASDINPLAGLNKRQGKQLLRTLEAPEKLITKAPTADLLDNKPAQPDETELGVTYDQIDDYLEGREVEETAAKIIEDHFLRTVHKREMPVSFLDFTTTNEV